MSARYPVRATESARLWAIAGAGLVLDALTKVWAAQTLTLGHYWPSASSPARLRLAFNANLNLGLTLPGGGRLIYSLLGTAVMLVILITAWRLSADARRYVIALGLLIGGGLGNLLERMLRGSVTDFLNLHAGSFNVADVLLTLGLLLYLRVRVRDGFRQEGWTWRTIWTIPHILPPSVRVSPRRA